MSKLDLNKYQPVDNQAQVTQIGTPTENAPATDTAASTVTITGPLSSVYAEALLKVLGENTTRLSNETNQVESAAILMVHQQLDKEPEDSVVYVNDTDTITQQPSRAFDELRIALDAQAKKRYVVLEMHGRITRPCGVLSDYAQEHADRVFYSRESFMKFIAR
jgi:hypothetical protein